MTVENFISKLSNIVPSNLALSFDNVGLLIGDKNSYVSGIYVALDINEEIIDRAVDMGINTIVSHHPIIFNSTKNLSMTPSRKKIIKCIQNNINVICCHTNLDSIINGINDELVNILGFKYNNKSILQNNSIDSDVGIGRIITLTEPLEIGNIVNDIKKKLNLDALRTVNCDLSNKVRKICIINGSGNGMVNSCFDIYIDLLITGDVTYHTAFEAIENNLSIIDVGHFHSENIAYLSCVKKIFANLNLDNISVEYDTLLQDVYRYI